MEKNKNVGIHLSNFSSDEEYQRSAISRLYYSCFGPSKEYYEKAFWRTLLKKDAHHTLIKSLRNSPFIDEQQLGNSLKNLRNMRNHADYNPKSQSFSIKNSIQNVEDIHNDLDNLNKLPVRLMKK